MIKQILLEYAICKWEDRASAQYFPINEIYEHVSENGCKTRTIFDAFGRQIGEPNFGCPRPATEEEILADDDVKYFRFDTDDVNKIIVYRKTGDVSGSSDAVEGYKLVELDSTSITPENFTIYSYALQGNETFEFDLEEGKPSEFYLNLIMPDPAVSFTFPTDLIKWEYGVIPDFSTANKVYRLHFIYDGTSLIGEIPDDMTKYARKDIDNIFNGNQTINGDLSLNGNTVRVVTRDIDISLDKSQSNGTRSSISYISVKDNDPFPTFTIGKSGTGWGATQTRIFGIGVSIVTTLNDTYGGIKFNGKRENTAGGFSIFSNDGNLTIPHNTTISGNTAGNSATISNDDGNIILKKSDNTYADFTCGNITINGDIVSKGMAIATLAETSIVPVDNKVFKHDLLADDDITIDTTALTADYQVNFELHLKQPATSVAFTWGTTMIWGDGNIFDSSNAVPAMDEANTVYVVVIRWDGENLLANLAYKKVIA